MGAIGEGAIPLYVRVEAIHWQGLFDYVYLRTKEDNE